jgi:hypothetical protein
MEEEEIGQEFDRVIRAGMMATSNVADAIARRSAEQARVQREAALAEARAADVATKRAEQLAREAAHDDRALQLENIRATQATEAEKNRLTREAVQVADRSIGRDEWWKNATPARIADTVTLAAEAAEKSPVAANVYERMSGKVHVLYGIDVDQVRAAAGSLEATRHSALANAVDDALARRREEAEAANERTEAAVATKVVATAPEQNSDYEYGQDTDAESAIRRARVADVPAERHEDAATARGLSENVHMAKAAAAQNAASKLASSSFPDTANVAIQKAQRRGAAKARVNRESSQEHGVEQAIER